MNIVIMAGGGGTRLWPLSRRQTPKQFIDLGGGKTLIQMVFERAQQLTDLEHIYLATNASYQEQVTQQLPEVRSDHIFYEPEKRDTAAAFASVALRLQQQNRGSEPTTFMWADHVFTNEDLFLSDLKKIPDLLAKYPEHICMVGHNPITPETTLGYMEVGKSIEGFDRTFHLKSFKEKPDLATAQQFITAGNFYWNLGYFSLYPDYFVKELSERSPEYDSALKSFAEALDSGQEADINQAYSTFPKNSIDYALIEKTERIIAITGDYGWSDVGNWGIVKEIFGTDGDHVPHGHHLHVHCDNNYIYNTTNKTVSLLGVKDSIVVVTDDAILITDKDHAPQVKDVVAKLENDDKHDIL